jgi:Flp pilus assembly protein protease CpaA
MNIQCGKCGKAFKAKLMTLSDQAKCPHCRNTVLFSDVRMVRQTNKIFWFGVLVLAFLSIYLVTQDYQGFGLPDWLAAAAVLLLCVCIFAPLGRLLMCILYNKFRMK